MIPLRGPRLLILVAIILISLSLYTFYPSDPFRRPHSPDEAYDHYEAGGIDSEHYGERIVPKFGDDECDGPDGSCLPGIAYGDKSGADASAGESMMDEELRSDADSEADEADEAGIRGKYGKQRPVGVSHAANGGLSEDILGGGVIMPKLENATAKAELGRAAWRVMHLMTLRYPEHPTPDDRSALKSYFHLFSRLYPCGECAEEFQKLLKQYPPQTSSRKTASMWLCSVHNMVNERLGKPDFDCLTLNDVYDCGCGPEGEPLSGDGDGDGDGAGISDGHSTTPEVEQKQRAASGAKGRGANKRPVHLVDVDGDDGANDDDSTNAAATRTTAATEDEDEAGEEEDDKLDIDEAEDEKLRLEESLEGKEPDLSHQQYKQASAVGDVDGGDEERDQDVGEGEEDAEEVGDGDEAGEGEGEGQDEDEGEEEEEEEQQFRILPIDRSFSDVEEQGQDSH